MKPTIGRIVIYRSRTGDYDVPAIINATRETLSPKGVEAGHVPDLSTDLNVHLTVLTPGKPNPDLELPAGATSRNAGGTYQEWDIPMDGSQPVPAGHDESAPREPEPGTWRWPERA